jgi:hypothetical protein
MPPKKSGAVTAQAQGALNKEVHEASLRAAKGSVTKNPTAPRVHARPHR